MIPATSPSTPVVGVADTSTLAGPAPSDPTAYTTNRASTPFGSPEISTDVCSTGTDTTRLSVRTSITNSLTPASTTFKGATHDNDTELRPATATRPDTRPGHTTTDSPPDTGTVDVVDADGAAVVVVIGATIVVVVGAAVVVGAGATVVVDVVTVDETTVVDDITSTTTNSCTPTPDSTTVVVVWVAAVDVVVGANVVDEPTTVVIDGATVVGDDDPSTHKSGNPGVTMGFANTGPSTNTGTPTATANNNTGQRRQDENTPATDTTLSG